MHRSGDQHARSGQGGREPRQYRPGRTDARRTARRRCAMAAARWIQSRTYAARGTVPRIAQRARSIIGRRVASARTHCTSRPQVLACGTGVPDGAGGEHVSGELLGVDVRHRELAGFKRTAGGRCGRFNVEQVRQLDRAARVVAETEHVRRERAQVSDNLRGMRRRQDAALATHQAGREPYGEAITVAAEIEHMRARGQSRRQRAHIVEELSRGNR